jgi:hypothetical protein
MSDMQEFESRRRRRAVLGIVATLATIALCLVINTCARSGDTTRPDEAAANAAPEGQGGQEGLSPAETSSADTATDEDAGKRQAATRSLKSAQWTSAGGTQTLVFHDYFFEELEGDVVIGTKAYTVCGVASSEDGSASIITCEVRSGTEAYETTFTYRPATADEREAGAQAVLFSEAFTGSHAYLGHVKTGIV